MIHPEIKQLVKDREAAGVSRQKLSKVSGVSASTLWGYETGQTQNPSSNNLVALRAGLTRYLTDDEFKADADKERRGRPPVVIRVPDITIQDPEETMRVVYEALTEGLGTLGRFTTVEERQIVASRISKALGSSADDS